MLYRYLLILIACAAVLGGVQVPNFLDQYAKRVDAHRAEAEAALAGYRQIAERETGGSLEALIARHDASTDPVFKAEAAPIRNLYERYRRFAAEQAGLQTDWLGRLRYVLLHPDRELLLETRRQYSPALVLDRSAFLSGGLAALLALLIVELLAAVLRALFAPRRHELRW
ncbi:MAG: DUF2937 family protein [Nevskia sp.]|nr:DUF2937 family protein [Nevskia sp.]